jgi:hypothetical protein
MPSIDMRTGSLKDDTKGTKEDLHKEPNHRIQVETQASKTLVESTRHGFEPKIEEVRDVIFQGLETSQREIKTQLVEVEIRGAREFNKYSNTEARIERWSCQRTGNESEAQNPKFEGSTPWAVF